MGIFQTNFSPKSLGLRSLPPSVTYQTVTFTHSHNLFSNRQPTLAGERGRGAASVTEAETVAEATEISGKRNEDTGISGQRVQKVKGKPVSSAR